MKRATTAFANALKIPQLCSVRFEDIQAPLGFQPNEDQQVVKNAISVKSTWTQSSIASGSKVSFIRLDLCVQSKLSDNDMTDGDSEDRRWAGQGRRQAGKDRQRILKRQCWKNAVGNKQTTGFD